MNNVVAVVAEPAGRVSWGRRARGRRPCSTRRRSGPRTGTIPLPSLVAGDEVFTLLERKCGKERSELLGAARCRVVDVAGDILTVEVVAANPPWFVGRRLECPRPRPYAERDRAENAAFGRLLSKFWGQPIDSFSRSA